MEKIRLHGSYVKQMAKEYGCTAQTVRLALYYWINSDLAKKIRQRAKEYLQHEIELIDAQP